MGDRTGSSPVSDTKTLILKDVDFIYVLYFFGDVLDTQNGVHIKIWGRQKSAIAILLPHQGIKELTDL